MIRLTLDQDGSGKDYDRELRSGDALPCVNYETTIVTKADGTQTHQAIVLLKFRVRGPDGKNYWAIQGMSAREFISTARAIEAVHPLADTPPSKAKAGTTYEGQHRGVGFSAVMIEKAWIVTTEAAPGQISLAHSDEEMKAVGAKFIDLALGSAD